MLLRSIFSFLCIVVLLGKTAQGACAPTPVAAARLAVGENREASPVTMSAGFRAVGVHWDPLLKKMWFRVLDCEHPERPGVLVPVSLQAERVAHAPTASAPESKPRVLAVRAGETVDLLYQQGPAEIHVRGVSEGNGYVGDHITLRPMAAVGSQPELRLHASVTAEGQGVLLP